MLSKIYLKLLKYFKKLYLSSLKSFNIEFNPGKINQDVLASFPEEIKNDLKNYIGAYNRIKNELKEEDKYLDNEIKRIYSEYKQSLGESIYLDDFKIQLELEPKKIKKIFIKKKLAQIQSNIALYLINFDKKLTISEVKLELLKLGFRPVDTLKTIIFLQKYKESIKKYLPILVIDAYIDCKKEIGIKENGLYSLALIYDSKTIKFRRIGEMEELMQYGHVTTEKNFFLVEHI